MSNIDEKNHKSETANLEWKAYYTWNHEKWLKDFRAKNADYRGLRKNVWKNTLNIVKAGCYKLPEGGAEINLFSESEPRRFSKFYDKLFTASFEPLKNPPEITVVAEDCLDVARKWINDGLEVSVLNMASRRNPGGGVVNGAGAQEEYLFRCSNYYQFLYQYAPYAAEYNLKKSPNQYPLDKNFGGVYSEGVTIFRENEESGYKLIAAPWKVNIIAVAGMNSPRLVLDNGELKIAPELVEGVKNKLHTIFRIACDNGQRNLVLGAIGCGAFKNPPKHVAELFSAVLCEAEFLGAFEKICFAVKTSHTSNGDTNYLAFKNILQNFIPSKKNFFYSEFENPIKKIAIGRDSYAVLKKNGEVHIVDIYKNSTHFSKRFSNCKDIAAGFHHMLGLCEDGTVEFKTIGGQGPHCRENWYGGIAVAACEYHSAMLNADGSAVCAAHSWDVPQYSSIIESWRNIKQIALTFDEPYALTKDGKFLCRIPKVCEWFNIPDKKIIQIAAFGCYYSQMTVAALYSDGTVKAFYGFLYDYDEITKISTWQNVQKICCGGHSAVYGLTNSGKVLFSYDDETGKKIQKLTDIVDIAANFEHFIAVNRIGEIIYIKDNGK